jgi:hypothetical protein
VTADEVGIEHPLLVRPLWIPVSAIQGAARVGDEAEGTIPPLCRWDLVPTPFDRIDVTLVLGQPVHFPGLRMGAGPALVRGAGGLRPGAEVDVIGLCIEEPGRFVAALANAGVTVGPFEELTDQVVTAAAIAKQRRDDELRARPGYDFHLGVGSWARLAGILLVLSGGAASALQPGGTSQGEVLIAGLAGLATSAMVALALRRRSPAVLTADPSILSWAAALFGLVVAAVAAVAWALASDGDPATRAVVAGYVPGLLVGALVGLELDGSRRRARRSAPPP